jgi:hypothetical protein
MIVSREQEQKPGSNHVQMYILYRVHHGVACASRPAAYLPAVTFCIQWGFKYDSKPNERRAKL